MYDPTQGELIGRQKEVSDECGSSCSLRAHHRTAYTRLNSHNPARQVDAVSPGHLEGDIASSQYHIDRQFPGNRLHGLQARWSSVLLTSHAEGQRVYDHALLPDCWSHSLYRHLLGDSQPPLMPLRYALFIPRRGDDRAAAIFRQGRDRLERYLPTIDRVRQGLAGPSLQARCQSFHIGGVYADRYAVGSASSRIAYIHVYDTRCLAGLSRCFLLQELQILPLQELGQSLPYKSGSSALGSRRWVYAERLPLPSQLRRMLSPPSRRSIGPTGDSPILTANVR
jgi:hypothetical protein